MYNHDIHTVTEQILPPHLRKTAHVAWVKLLTSMLGNTWDKFRNSGNGAVAVINDRLNYNGQVCYLLKALVDKVAHNPALISIEQNNDERWQVYIYNLSDAQDQDARFIFNEVDMAGPLFTETYILNTTDYMYDYDFKVMIYPSLDTNEIRAQIMNIVNLYKVAGKKYIIQSIML